MKTLKRNLALRMILMSIFILSLSGANEPDVLHAHGLYQITCTVSWITNADGFWDIPTNWSTGNVPSLTDDVCINVAGDIIITHRQDVTTVNSIQSEEALLLSGGTLNVATTIQVNNTFNIDGGTLQNATMLPGVGGQGLIATTNLYNRLVGVTLNGNLDLSEIDAQIRIAGGLTLNGTIRMSQGYTRLVFEDSQTLSGSGTVSFEGTYATRILKAYSSPITLTIGSGITLRGGAATIGHEGGDMSIVNLGTIIADAPGQSILIDGLNGTFINQGTLDAHGGIIDIDRQTGNLGTALVSNGGHLDLDNINGDSYIIDQTLDLPEGSTLTLQGDWHNSSVINATNATVNLGGTFALADLGTFNRSGGIVNLVGILENVGTTLALDASSGDWQIAGGTVLSGTITTVDNAKLIATPNVYNRLVGVTLNGNLDLSEIDAQIRIAGGLTLNGTIRMSQGYTRLVFEDSQTLSGSGTVSFEGTYATRILKAYSSPITLTIGSGITLRGGAATIGHEGGDMSIVNLGTIIADAPGQSILIDGLNGTFVNQGTLVAQASSTLDINKPLTIDILSKLDIQPSATIAVAGNFLGDTQDTQLFVPLGTVRLDGTGTTINPQNLEAMSQDLGSDPTGFDNNFAYGTLELGNNTFVQLVDQANNALGTGGEAVYVSSLVVPVGTTMDLNGLNLYARSAQLDGTVIGGTIGQIPDSGPIEFGISTPGTISVSGESDEWTFFARAGRKITLFSNPGAGNPPEPILPRLNWIEISLLDPNGTVLATGSNSQSGTQVTLSNIVLPVDGTYRIQIDAPINHPDSTGNYLVTLWDSSADEATLLLNHQVTGRIETPLAEDHWNFTAVAGQQIRFDMVNRSSSGLLFRLIGPGNSIIFDDLDADSALITLDSSGDYVLTAYGSAGQTGDYAFNLLETSQVTVTLDTPYSGALVGSGQAQIFRLDVPQATPLLVTLDDNSTLNHNEIYLRHGNPPTRSDYEYRFATALAADQQALVPMAAPGTWYILLYGEAVPSPSSYTLLASTADLFVTGVTPSRLGNGADALLSLSGAGFVGVSAVDLVASGGTLYPASSFDVHSPTHLAASFAAGSVPPGTYAVQVTTTNNGSSQLDDAVIITSGGTPKLETHLILPGTLGFHIAAELYVEYANTGNVAMPSPVLVLHATDNAFMTLDRSLVVGGLNSVDPPDGFSDTVQILAFCDTPGLLQPGDSCRVPVYWGGVQAPGEPGTFDFTLTVSTADDPTPIDWNTLKESARPDRVDPATWEPIWANLVAQTGSTWGDYIGMLDDNAAYLGRLDQDVRDINQLFGFELQQANNALHPVNQLASASDTSLPTPGLGLSFSRVFPNSITGRNQMGPLGRGWYHIWQASLGTEPDGTLFITGPDGSQRRFQPNRRGGFGPDVYYSLNGDYGTLTDNPDGTFTLQEKNGLLRHFRADGKFDYVEDTDGNRITAGYSGDQLTSLTHSAGQSLQLTYNGAGLIETVSDSQGRVITYSYDTANEHLTSVQSYDGRVTNYTYNTGGIAARKHALLSIEAPSGVHRFYSYDTRGRLTSAYLDGDAEHVDFAYDSAGELSITDALNNTTRLFFDQRGLPVRVEDPLGNVTNATYDESFNLSGIINAAGLSYTYKYDNRGNLTSNTDPLGQTTAFSYSGPFDRLASVTDARGNATRFAYDGAGNMVSTTYPNNTVERLTYDALGNPLTLTNRRGRVIGFSYNTDGQMTDKNYADGSQVDYTYGARGNLATAIDASGTMTFTYDTGDRLTGVTYPGGRFLQYTYDLAGRRIQMVDQDGFAVNYGYDSLGRLAVLTDTVGTDIASYSYNAAGWLERKDLGNGTYTTYAYDAVGQILSLVNHAPDDSVNSRFDYTYGPLGQRLSMDTLDGQWRYEYDATGQLILAVFTSINPAIPDQDLSYEYDAVGNRVRTIENGVTTSYVTNNMNQYLSVGTASHAYDADGNLISIVDVGETSTYTFDDENRLNDVVTSAGDWTYEYDALGNRFAANDNGQQTEYLLDPTGLVNVIGEYDGLGSLIANYTYGVGLTSRVDVSGVAYFDFDALGSTVGLTGLVGSPLNSYSYLPFGRQLGVFETIANQFTFVGQLGVMEESNGLDFMRARYYLPVEGRFISEDPIGFLGGDINLYQYVSSDPVNFVDPIGLLTGPQIMCGVANVMYDALCLLTGPAAFECGVGSTFYFADCDNKENFPDIPPPCHTAQCHFPPVPPDPQPAPFPFPDCHFLEECGGGGGGNRCHGSNCSGGGPGGGTRGGTPPQPPGNPGGGGGSGASGSWDPNEKTGPVGFGSGGYVQPGSAFPYRIDFENDAVATAPAQRVDIFDQLDNNLDWSTFTFTEIGFDDTFIAVPPDSQYFFTTVEMTYNNRDFHVEIELQFDSLRGQVLASFHSLDPVSGLPPDVLTGFLPPEDGTGRGQGHVNYIVGPKGGLATGTEIRNIALIRFDFAEIIATNQVNPHDPSQGTDPAREALATIDADPPTSTVNVLPATSSPSFTVSWSGNDGAGSGIATYDIYVSENGGAFTLWQDAVTTTSATYEGTVGATYAFYSVATDNVGYVQLTPAGAQATTTITDMYFIYLPMILRN